MSTQRCTKETSTESSRIHVAQAISIHEQVPNANWSISEARKEATGHTTGHL
ncbi:hypothetical protein [Arthrobacter methylotrophus]|uniref:hypothetical protein n=1 Tax=Arthrobacter methylotrophus TaxID=121291 RepID=UPI0031E54B96